MSNVTISCLLSKTHEMKSFSSLSDFFNSTEDIEPVPPINVEVDSKSSLDSTVKELIAQYGRSTVTNHSFTCKLDKMGLALPLKDAEIKGLAEDEFPIVLSINSADDIITFASAYDKAVPVKRVTTKNLHKKEVLQNATVSKWAIAAIAAFALVVIGFLFFVSHPNLKIVNDKDEYKTAIVKSFGGLNDERGLAIASLSGDYSKKELEMIKKAYSDGVVEIAELNDKLLEKMAKAGDISKMKGLEDVFRHSNVAGSVNLDNEKAYKGNNAKLPSWVYGIWSCTTPYGTETMEIKRGGEILNLSYGSYSHQGDIDSGTYTYSDGVIRAKFPKDGGLITTMPLDLVNHQIEYGSGYYWHKRD